MIVIDASVLTNALTDDGPLGTAAREALADESWAAPSHLVAEVFSAIRGRVLGGHVESHRAGAALIALAASAVTEVDVRLLLPRMWALRHNASGYDAAYLAAAERLSCELVTADARLAAVTGARCGIRVPTLEP